MPGHSKPVTRITVADNPEVKAPAYPGKFRRNNEKGSTITKEEWLQEQTDEWLRHMKGKPAYNKTYLSDKALVLLSHLSNTLLVQHRGKVDYPKCRQLVASSEQRLAQQQEGDENGEQDDTGAGGGEVGGGGGVEGLGEQELQLQQDREMSGQYEERLEDKDWAPGERSKERTQREFEIEQLLKKTDEELFEGEAADVNGNIVESLKRSPKLKERKEVYGLSYVNSKTDKDLFESEASISKHVIETEAFKDRVSAYSLRFYNENCEGETSQDLLCSLSQTPEVVKQSNIFKQRLRHLSKKEKSQKVAMQSLQETLEALKLNKCKEGREQHKILAASVTSLEFGVPDLGLSSRDEKEVVQMKERLMSGEEKSLKTLEKPMRQAFPPILQEVAKQHWEDITVTEPAKHRWLSKAVKDGEETAPSRYQTMTNEETYESFKESCKAEVTAIMVKHSQERMAFYSRRPDSHDKDYRMRHAHESIPNKFPSMSWRLEQRPREVKPMHDHTTGLCKVNP